MSETKKEDFNFKNTTQAKIPLEMIRENAEALRVAVDKQDEHYQELVASVKKRGIMNPILVREIKNPENGQMLYGLIDGLHRFNAAMDAGLTEIPAQIGSLEDADLLEAQILANVHRIETKAVQYTKALISVMGSNPLLTMSELAARLSKSISWLRDRLQLVKLTPDIQKLVDNDNIGLANAYALAKLPPEKQTELSQQAISMSPGEFVPIANAAYQAIKSARATGQPVKEVGFVPAARLQRPATLKEELAAFEKKEFTSSKVGNMVLSLPEVQAQPDVVKLLILKAAEVTLKFSMHLDDASIAEDKAKYDERKKTNEENKKKREAERAKAKDEAAGKVLDENKDAAGHARLHVNLEKKIPL